MEQPSACFRRAAEAYLWLFSRCDQEIEVSPGGLLVISRAWEIWREYVKRPGHVVQMARKVVEFIKTGKIGSLEMKEVQNTLKSISSDSQKDSILLPFLKAVDAFYREWASLHPDMHPKRPTLNLERSAERLSKRSSASTPSHLVSTPKSPAPKSPHHPFTPASPYQSSTPKSPSQSSTPKSLYQSSTPKSLYQSSTPKSLYQSSTPKNPFSLSIEKIHNQACMGLKEIDPNVQFTGESDDSPSPCKRPAAEAKRVEWEVELGFRRLLADKMRDRDGDLTGENAKTLFGEMSRTVMTNEWRRRQKAVIGERLLDEIISEFRRKLETVSFVKREALKAALRVKTEGQNYVRQRHFV